ncbi:hypothetical protein DENSPDRAFT_489269 [Dentipellis sp. KUC8613]|nr:hypothetical protein DENSPDRAFT_489269 [Dentipellis sp. KUC8613]
MCMHRTPSPLRISLEFSHSKALEAAVRDGAHRPAADPGGPVTAVHGPRPAGVLGSPVVVFTGTFRSARDNSLKAGSRASSSAAAPTYYTSSFTSTPAMSTLSSSSSSERSTPPSTVPSPALSSLSISDAEPKEVSEEDKQEAAKLKAEANKAFLGED